MNQLRHSGFGIAAFVISVMASGLMLALFAVAGFLEARTPGGLDGHSLKAVAIGLGLIGLVAAELVALGLGIAGLVQRGRNRLFAVLGTVFSAAALTVVTGIVVLGLATSA